MSYIKQVIPGNDFQLLVIMENGNSINVNMKKKIETIRFCVLDNYDKFIKVKTDGEYIIWDEGRIKVGAGELMEIFVMD